MNTMRKSWFGGVILAAASALMVAGCGSKDPPVLKGAVSYEGKPVPFGQVVFYDGPIVRAIAPIGPDGTFNLSDVPEGESFKVAVTTLQPIPASRINGPPPGSGPDNLPRPPGSEMAHGANKGGAPGAPTLPGQEPQIAPTPPPSAPLPKGVKEPPGSTMKQPPGPPSMVMPLPPMNAQERAEYAAIEKKYGDPEKSGLEYKKSSGLTFNLDLTKE